ncbi:MAG: 5-deoxy-glucuronate isomerase [Chloroflexales bacterium]|nr:5-deoxy-glucuronate isomerase [Chloroflexales bacterium]
MPQYTEQSLIVHPGSSADPDVVVEVTPELAGWDYIHFQVRRLRPGQRWSFATGEHELALVPLSGTISVESDRGQWAEVGGRANVFAGLPHALYLPRQTTLSASAPSEGEFAVAWVAADQDYAPRLVTPADVTLEIRGGDNATRQINGILPPGFPCQRLVVVEVYTPGGNWSSYPPHKHDTHKTAPDGGVLEADLEEVYYYKIDRPEGFAMQRVYTEPESPLARAGTPFDVALLVHSDDVVLIPEGHHPVASPPGYTTYYLNVLAGSAQSLANKEDQAHAWVKATYQRRDPRVPIYDVPRRA